MRKLLLISFAFIFLYSCSKDDSEDVPRYYPFLEQDYPLLLNKYNEPNKKLIFQNQDGEQNSFTLKSFVDEKEYYGGTGGGFGPPTSGGDGFYYDTREIIFAFDQYNSGESELTFQFNRLSDSLKGGIRFPLWNIDQFYTGSIGIELHANSTSMSFNDQVFSDVILLRSNSQEAPYQIGSYSRNVNILYYDLSKGLIGFDDIDGNEWRLL